MPIPDPPSRDVDHLDEWATHIGGILDALLVSLPKSHPDHYSSPRELPKRSKKAITSEGRPLPEPIPLREEEPEPEPECSFCGGTGERLETVSDFTGFRTTIVLDCPHD